MKNKKNTLCKTSQSALPPMVYDALQLPAADEKTKLIFIEYLKTCVALDKSEKLRVIDKMPELSEYQITELIKEFNAEHAKLSNHTRIDIREKNPSQLIIEPNCRSENLQKIIKQRNIDWEDIVLILKKRIFKVYASN